ncbi:MAG: thioredoxin domain-containing protein [Gammaproteobacteria bacterium]|nr:thioredoxin domain-containing protein [Gammaproteobacteria bacterium]|tara:strand:+ start:3176 stop:5263 length:2088 start_codon:yes stop_codon:yes gene_type:complete
MSNRLADETSPYLRQHADNPVDWYPWSDEALSLARRRQQPILLSIGYSACHWCHVMAHESFEDPEVAAVMNGHFVNVKVDREERPDLDKVYQLSHQLLTQAPGGWPLTMFLDPDTLVPFFGGTYFPRTARHGLPGFRDLLVRIVDVFESRREELSAQGEKVADVLASLDTGPLSGEGEGVADEALLQSARDALAAQYDSADGGFGRSPKFPMPGTLERLLRHWAGTARAGQPDRAALDMVMTTLTRMARGGIHDHLGGGFCRYATDRRWMVPHFEKMLYDNGLLLGLYTDALALGPDPLFELAVTGIVDWLERDMRHPEGAFHAALDADSEGEEGRYYLWRRNEVKRLLTEDEYLVIETLYGLDKPANFEGRWILHRYDAWAGVVSRLSLDTGEAAALWSSAREKMLAARTTREAPALDDKILTSWNALAIHGLAKAAVQLDRPDWLDMARSALDFLRDRLFVDGRLMATWKDGVARHPAYLDDHAFLLQAALTLLGAGWRDEDARLARTLAEALLARFEDTEAGGFFFTAHDHETLICRPKPTMDDAVPPGNAVAARALSDLGHLLGDARYLEAANRTIDWARKAMEAHPAGHCSMLTALEEVTRPPELIVIRGPAGSFAPWLAAARDGYRPRRRVYAIPAAADPRLVPPYLPRLVSADSAGKTTAYRCEGFSCSLPIGAPEALAAELERGDPR